ncbi:DNA-binding response regulator [Rhizobium sp. 25PS6]|uniref:RNA polymerase sigma factor n=1 Tax=Rhizobium sp. 25PS6 TaxID=3075622 RepID=UPI0028FCFF63|nr:DNA-binding response regulator [Rhizobium sp. 25PS6]MDU0364521.1 DNA-binding response regulator [Rhizobium sp. 25PS6]
MIEALRKHHNDGRLYERRADTTVALLQLENLSQEQLVERAKIRAKTDPLYLSSECLLHHIRQSRRNNSDRFFESLFRVLLARVESAATLRSEIYRLPNGKVAITAFGTKVREYVVDRFMVRLMADRDGYDERLDYFEVNFAHAIAALRSTAKSKAVVEERRSQPLSANDDEEVSAEVEKATGTFDPFDVSRIDDENYRSRLLAAIKNLPEKERHVVALIFKEYPIESNDPDKPSICRLLGCVEKTVRNRRDRAFEKLKAALSEEEIDA